MPGFVDLEILDEKDDVTINEDAIGYLYLPIATPVVPRSPKFTTK